MDLYPQLDRDNVNENPQAAKSFAVRSPLGQVVTNDPLKSITRETNDKLITKIGFGPEIASFTDSTTSGTITFTTDHNIGGLINPVLKTADNSGFTNGTYLNVKVYTSPSTQNDTTWNGTLAKVVVSGGAISEFEITNAGSGWQITQTGHFDKSVIGNGSGNNGGVLGSNASGANLTSAEIGTNSELVLQATGIGTTADSYFNIVGVPNKTQVLVTKSSADVNPIAGQYGFVVSPTSFIASRTFTPTEGSVGITSVRTTTPHGLVSGNKFQLNDGANNKVGTFIVKSKLSPIEFTFESTNTIPNTGRILKHGLSANDGVSEKGNENLSSRGVELFGIENSKLETAMDNVGSAVTFSASTSNVKDRFPYSSYILVDEEIMRVSSKTVSSGGGGTNNVLTVLRGVFGTLVSSHADGSLIKKINPFPIQFNRPSILRASGHTFEYLGYGPGNYSTALPQVQVKTISEKEEFLSQSQERAGGAVVYTGMNNKGDFYIGNQKKSALTGEEITFDTPVPSVAGEDPGRLSVVFDETTIKERLVVEGGQSKTALSEFDGPVTFNNEVQIKDSFKVKSTTDSTSSTSGSLIISGGVGIAKTVNLPDNSAIKFGNEGDLKIFHDSDDSFVEDTGTGSLKLKGSSVELIHGSTKTFETTSTGAIVTGILTATSFRGDGSQLEGLNNSQLLDSGSAIRAAATTNGITITGDVSADGGTFGNITVGVTDDQTINTSSGNLVLNATGIVEISKPLEVTGTITSSSDIIAFSLSDIKYKENLNIISSPLDKVGMLTGYTYTWKDNSPEWCESGSLDTGVIAQDVDKLGLPGITTTRDDGDVAVYYPKIIPVLIEAIKELTAKVTALENK